MAREREKGSFPHTKAGCLTIVNQDSSGGLEVETAPGEWIEATAIPNAFVINIGDMLYGI
jgi:isopenicillin N synthase-like dioxygenase